jgi:hypothetical protein
MMASAMLASEFWMLRDVLGHAGAQPGSSNISGQLLA